MNGMDKNIPQRELSELIHAVFPDAPVPKQVWLGDVLELSDIPQGISERILHRPWTNVTMLDWRMTGAHASAARNCLNAEAFRYYLPSLLIGGLTDFEFIDWPQECLLPAGRRRRTTGTWWTTFYDGLSIEQKDVVKSYLTDTRRTMDRTIHLAELRLVDQAQSIWGT